MKSEEDAELVANILEGIRRNPNIAALSFEEMEDKQLPCQWIANMLTANIRITALSCSSLACWRVFATIQR